MIKPQRLQPGDKICLITPAFQALPAKVRFAKERLEAQGLEVVMPDTLMNRDGYFAGTVEEKVTELHNAFADPSVKAIMAVRGGYGCARLLKHLDYELIAANPKIVLGYSDITSLLMAIYTQTGLITFHGPSAGYPLPEFSQHYLHRVLFGGEAVSYENPHKPPRDDVISTAYRPHTITPGVVKGRLMGGNLTVLASLLGSPFVPEEWEDVILFLEEVHEESYSIDRMLCHLDLVGILPAVKGVILGSFTDCHSRAFQSFDVETIVENTISALGVPAYANAMIGHQEEIFTLPIGAEVELDASNCTFRLLEPAVVCG